MAIESYLHDRIKLEKEGYRSAKHLSRLASWIFWDGNMQRAIDAGYFEEVDNGRYKPSMYYKLTAKGMSELKRVGRGFTYGDTRGKSPIYYQSKGGGGTRWVKVSRDERQSRAMRLLSAYKRFVTAGSAHEQYELEKKGWFPARTTHPPDDLLEAGLIERKWRGQDGKTAYYRLTPKGKKRLVKARLKKLKMEQSQDRRKLNSEQAAARRRLPRETNVRNWNDFEG